MSEEKPPEVKEPVEEKPAVIDPKLVLEMIIELANIYGDFAERLGNLQKTYNKAYELVSKFTGTEAPEKIMQALEKAPPNVVGLFLQILIKANSLTPRMSKLMELSAEEKIKLGNDLKSLSEDFRELLRKTERE